MIYAKFLYEKDYAGFIVSGHAGGKYGRDIICAGASSAVMLTLNTISDFFTEEKSDIKIRVSENSAGILLKKPNAEASKIIKSLKLHLEALNRQKYFSDGKNAVQVTVYNKPPCRYKVLGHPFEIYNFGNGSGSYNRLGKDS